MKIVEEHTHNYSKNKKKNEYIIIHCTSATIKSTIRWFRSIVSRVSAHYVIDKQGTIYKFVPEEYNAWHAGKSEWDGKKDINRYSIGIELENMNDYKDEYPDAQMISLISLCRDICKRHNIPKENILGHKDIAPKRKVDPLGLDLNELRNIVFSHQQTGG